MTFQNEESVSKLDLALGAMSAALECRDYDRYLALEGAFYSQVIKINENFAHYERCFSAVDPIGQVYGDVLRSSINDSRFSPTSSLRVCYLLPNIDNDLAHIEFLFHVLKHHPVFSDLKITVAGYAYDDRPVGSRLLTRLASEGRVSLLKVKDNHAGRLKFLKFFLDGSFSQLIVFSIPLQLSSWVRALGPDAVTWVSTKFELSAFAELRSRVSFFGSHSSTCDFDPNAPKGWARSSAAISRDSITPYQANGISRKKLVTVNRTEKIRTSEFLQAVRSILVSEPSATFAWTGRNPDPIIQGFFERAGIADRCEFIGWVDPTKALGKYDIFLDTYGLSGLVATQAFCGGMPTVFFRNSRAWVEIFDHEIDRFPNVSRNQILAASVADYVGGVLELIRNPEVYIARSNFQRDFAERFFFNENAMYESHVRLLVQIINAPLKRSALNG